MTFKMNLFIVTAVIFISTAFGQEVESTEKHDIEGKVLAPTHDPSWIGSTQVYIRGGQYIGFLR